MEMKDLCGILHRKRLSQSTVKLPGRAHCSLSRGAAVPAGTELGEDEEVLLGGRLTSTCPGTYLGFLALSSDFTSLFLCFFLQTSLPLHAENHTFALVPVHRILHFHLPSA